MSTNNHSELLHWAMTHGIIMGVNAQISPFVVTHAPITTNPFRFPESQFIKV